MKLYLAGPMSGYPDHNFPAFNAEAKRLRGMGFDIVNPAELNWEVDRLKSPETVWRACMIADIHALIECEGIALMDKWGESNGARLEHAIAVGLRLRVFLCKELYEAV